MTSTPRWLEELGELLAIPSVSADPARAADVRRAGEWVRDLVRRAGGTAELLPTQSHPLVVGEIAASHARDHAPTVLVYGHFDVQPPDPLDLWETDPFVASVRDGYLYARGAADDKGQLYLVLKAAELLAAQGELPVNVRVVCDGEEEIGGDSIGDFLEQDDRGADACLIFDGIRGDDGRFLFFVGTRGVLAFELRVHASERDLHSGLGNTVLNATHALMESLQALLPRAGRLPDELRAGALPVGEAERAARAELTPPAEQLARLGAVPYDDRAVDEFDVRTTAEPSIDVNGIVGGKPGLVNTTIPAEARANFTIRLAPGQDPETIAAAAERLLREAAPAGAQLELVRQATAAPAIVPADTQPVRLALDAVERVAGRRPLPIRVGGTLPLDVGARREGNPDGPDRRRDAGLRSPFAERAHRGRRARARGRDRDRALPGVRRARLALKQPVASEPAHLGDDRQ